MTRHKVELLAYLCAGWLLLVIYATGDWWAALGLLGLFLMGATPERGRNNREGKTS